MGSFGILGLRKFYIEEFETKNVGIHFRMTDLPVVKRLSL